MAEIGINHNGSLDMAKKLIDMAFICGADAVKFQKRTPKLCVPQERQGIIKETPWGNMTYLEYKQKIELGGEEYKKIDKYCKEKGIPWFASAWDVPSLQFLKQFKLPFYKVASPKLTDKKLLEELKQTKKPIFLSTGGSTLEQIKKAVELLKDTNDVIIMHCNSSYPAKDEELNLKVIQTLKNEFPNHQIGYSGHESGLAPSLFARMLGAEVIERHITLDRSLWGTDQAASVELPGLQHLVRDLKRIKICLGNGIKKVYDSEKKVMEKLRDKDTL